MPNQDYSIVAIEKKIAELNASVVKLGFDIISRMDKHEEIPEDLLANQKIMEKQSSALSKALSSMRKAESAGINKKTGIEAIFSEIGQIKLSMAGIQQKLN